MRFFPFLATIALLGVSSCSSSKTDEGEEVIGSIPAPESAVVEEVLPEPEVTEAATPEPLAELPKIEEQAPDLSTVGQWRRSSPVKTLPGQKELTPSLTPITLPVNEGSSTSELSGTLVSQP